MFRRPTARLFEVTRLMRLYANRPTGVDRVCLAYLNALIGEQEPCFGLARTRFGYLLFDQVGLLAIQQRLQQKKQWLKPNILHRFLIRKLHWEQPAVEAELRKLCLARCTPRFLARMLRRNLPEGTVYVNVDQANFSARHLQAIRTFPGMRVALFIHDVIPLDFPEYQTPEAYKKFEVMLECARVYANVILTNSHVSKEAITKHMSHHGPVPEITVAHLGVTEDYFQFQNRRPAPSFSKPYFVYLGTIEPRRNIPMLLDIWDRLSERLDKTEIPHLVICGRRGWMVQELTDRLDSSPLRGSVLHEYNDLEDDQIFNILSNATGMLFPSRVEGFGLPPVEAAMLGTPVICSDLPVFKEILGDYPVYVGVSDSYSWKKVILSLAGAYFGSEGRDDQERSGFSPPSWEAHFKTALRVT